MNIFFLDHDIKTLASYHCDKHCVKMILETAQLLATTYRLQNTKELSGLLQLSLPKATHASHPCRLWAGYNACNYLALGSIGVALCDEYKARYGRTHSLYQTIRFLVLNYRDINFPNSEPYSTVPPICMFPAVKDTARSDFKYLAGITEEELLSSRYYQEALVIYSYRFYYLTSKSHFAVWNHSAMPLWYKAKKPELGLAILIHPLELPAVDLTKY